MWWVVVLAAAAYALLHAKRNLRMPGGARDALLYLTGLLQGLRTTIISGDLKKAFWVLTQSGSDKGRVIEENLMLGVWVDACSIESCNGQLWRDVRSVFDHFAHQVPSVDSLEEHCLSWVPPTDDSKLVFDSPTFTKLTLQCFGQWLFQDDFQPAHLAALNSESWEIRFEVAMRGHGDNQLKRSGNQAIIDLLSGSSYSLPSTVPSWSACTAFSAVLQPFFISPSVNFIDIVIAMDSLCDLRTIGRQWILQGFPDAKAEIIAYICETMRLKHPFPVLERRQGGDQYFINLDTFFKDTEADFNPNKWIALQEHHPANFLLFGVGPRKCPGRHIAFACLPALIYRCLELSHQLNPSMTAWQPAMNHRFSGRNLDNAPTPTSEAWHVAKRIAYCLYDLTFRPRNQLYT
jgi:hypothetical protein